jgi:error-prone DNA polymerase
VTSPGTPPQLPEITAPEQTMADLWATSISPTSHPVEHIRSELQARGVLSAAALATATPGSRVRVGGVVTHRQRPATASGITFLNLEDETGMVNVVCSPGLWSRYRRIARDSAALVVRGRVEHSEGVTNLVADRLERLPVLGRSTSRDFR